MSPLVLSLIATLWVGVIALVGIVFLFSGQPGGRSEAFLLSFAAGVLLATAFLDLLPEAVARDHDGNIFAASPALGLATTFAVTVHEVPKEIADFTILTSSGYPFRTALLLNFATGLMAMLGPLLFFSVSAIEGHLAWFMTATAGMFIYIAASDLLPELHRSHTRREWLYAMPFFVGVAVIAAVVGLVPETH